MARTDEGITEDIHLRVTPEERALIGLIAQQMGLSRNKAGRWALRLAAAHAASSTDHQQCKGTSPCAAAFQGIRPEKP